MFGCFFGHRDEVVKEGRCEVLVTSLLEGPHYKMGHGRIVRCSKCKRREATFLHLNYVGRKVIDQCEEEDLEFQEV